MPASKSATSECTRAPHALTGHGGWNLLTVLGLCIGLSQTGCNAGDSNYGNPAKFEKLAGKQDTKNRFRSKTKKKPKPSRSMTSLDLPKDDHPFSVRDLLALRRISDPQVSPKGTKVTFTQRTTNLKGNRGDTQIWNVDVRTAKTKQITRHKKGAHSPRLSPDSRSLYFLSSRTGLTQIWRTAAGGGPAFQVTRYPVSITSFKLSPDGKHFAFSADVSPECDTLKCTAAEVKAHSSEKQSGQVYDKLFVRHWDTWKDGLRSHLFVLPVEDASTRKPVDITSALDADVPSKPFGGVDDYAFHPTEPKIVFGARISGNTEPLSTNFDLYVAGLDGEKAPTNLTGSNKAWDAHPVFSADGKTLAYVAMKRPGYESDRFEVMLKQWPDGPTRSLTKDWDRSIREMAFSDDNKHLYVTANDVGQTPLYKIDLATDEREQLVEQGSVRNIIPTGKDVLFLHSDLAHPAEIWQIDGSDNELDRVSKINRSLLKKAELGIHEQFSFPGWKGETVHGYLVRPSNFDEDKTYPVVFLIHGGPQGSFNNSWGYRWNPQTYAGAGYAVVMIDFHGSTGYGQSFTDSIRGDWGGKPLEDLKKGLSFALGKYDFLDGENVCALGASYGGYMVNWIAGNWPERFKCLVNHDGIFDQRSMYYSTEELWFPEWEHGGAYHDNPKGHERHNPVNHVNRWKTPMLVVQGGLDFRVPTEQSLATFTALQRKGIKSKYLYFPDENHWVLKPANSLQWHDTVLDWVDEHIKPKPAPKAKPAPK